MKQPSKAESLKRRIKLHKERIQKLSKRLEVIEQAEMTGSVFTDLKNFKNWMLFDVQPGDIYRLVGEIATKRQLYGRLNLEVGDCRIVLPSFNKYGDSMNQVIYVESRSAQSLYGFAEVYGIKDITMKVWDPSPEIKNTQDDLKRLNDKKKSYDDAVRLFQSKLKQEKN